jgi:hypothetical protein
MASASVMAASFAVTNDVDVDRDPLDAIARVATSEEPPAMRTTEAIDDYDLVAFRDNVEHAAALTCASAMARSSLVGPAIAAS